MQPNPHSFSLSCIASMAAGAGDGLSYGAAGIRVRRLYHLKNKFVWDVNQALRAMSGARTAPAVDAAKEQLRELAARTDIQLPATQSLLLERALSKVTRHCPHYFADVDFSGHDLRGLDLGDFDFTGADLSGADLTGANLSFADLGSADLTGAQLARANLFNSIVVPEQLLPARGLSPKSLEQRLSRATWNKVLPDDPGTRKLCEELLEDWDGTLQEAITTAELLRRA